MAEGEGATSGTRVVTECHSIPTWRKGWNVEGRSCAGRPGALKVIDTASNAVSRIPAGDGPLYGVAVIPSGGRIYVSHDTGDYVTALENERVIPHRGQ